MKNKFLTLGLLGIASISLAQINPIMLGSSSNGIEAIPLKKGIYPQQNTVAANDTLGAVLFMHRQDVTVWGGGAAANGKLRYDISIDGGTTFSNDIGECNPLYVSKTSAPQALIYNPTGNTSPLSAKVLWSAHTLNNVPVFAGFSSGINSIESSGFTTSHYEDNNFSNQKTHVQGGFCKGLAGQYWMAEQMHANSLYLDTLVIYKGILDNNTLQINWSVNKKVALNSNTSFDGNVYAGVPNMAFSPDGMKGWIAFAGDLAGGVDSVYSPVFLKTIDGGVTWSAPMEINLEQFSNLGDSTTGNKTGIDPDFDITVDIEGNPHFFCHAYGSKAYTRNNDVAVPWHAMVDLIATSNGSNWMAVKVAGANTFHVELGIPDGQGDLLEMQLFPQVSRSENGNFIFYSWVDSDTAGTFGIGYGQLNNIAPNLRIVGRDLTTGLRTPVKKITDGDIVWDGRAIFTTMAPTVLKNSTTFKLPIVAMSIQTNDQNQPCSYYYFGNDATLSTSEFTINDYTTTGFVNIPSARISEIIVGGNPGFGLYHLKASKDVNKISVQVFDVNGKFVKSCVHNSSEFDLDLQSVSAGIYNAKISIDNEPAKVIKLIKQ